MQAPANVTGSSETDELVAALVGNPNCGKTTLFNALTGMRQRVGNYPGVTVERKEGGTSLADGTHLRLLDLPGLYSLTPHSPDEAIAREVLLGIRPDSPRPDVVINVVDATNLERNLYVTSQILDTGIPVIIALTMTDMLEKRGEKLDAVALEQQLGVPVCVVVASRGEGLPEMLGRLKTPGDPPKPAWQVTDAVKQAISDLQKYLQQRHELPERAAFAEAVSLLIQDNSALTSTPQLEELIAVTREKLAAADVDFITRVIEARYAWASRMVTSSKSRASATALPEASVSERVDRMVMHPFWGYVLFFTVMALVFQVIFTLGQGPANAVQNGVGEIGRLATRLLPPGDLRQLFDAGVLGGMGTTLSFLPQILLLFFFIGLLEDTGYMARAAFLMDRLMSRVGLHGKSFIPLLSSFACAIPGIMATRTIGDRKARLITILVAPLMSCSARLPVYLLMTSAFIPNRRIIGIGPVTLLTLPGVTFTAMYFLGMVAAFFMAWAFHRTLLKGVSPSFLMELPPYRLPAWKTVVMQMLERSWLFIRRAGTVILSISVVIWFLSSYPKMPNAAPQKALTGSYLGQTGQLIAPVLRPLGFNWKMGVGIASSFIAREVFVSTMGTIYNVDSPDSRAGQADLGRRMKADINPRTGQKVFTPLVAVTLMVYYVLAMQCISTLAVVRRETNGWKWPIFQLVYMTALAWIVSFVIYHAGMALGWGVH